MLFVEKSFNIIHRWGGNSECDWIPWLKRELNKKDISAVSYNMPDTNRPKMDEWIQFISDVVGAPNEQTYFIGHSIGCQAIIRYISKLKGSRAIGGAVLVAPWVKLANLASDEESIARQWITTPIDWENARSHCKKFTIIYSNNDRWVSEGEAKSIGKRLNAKMVFDKGKGHFTDEDSITKLPSVLEESLAICKD